MPYGKPKSKLFFPQKRTITKAQKHERLKTQKNYNRLGCGCYRFANGLNDAMDLSEEFLKYLTGYI